MLLYKLPGTAHGFSADRIKKRGEKIMWESIKSFIYIYANCRNIFIPTAIIMLLLFIVYIVMSFIGIRSLKQIVNVLRSENGEDIICVIEELRLSKRYSKMWDEYYSAYCNEDMVNLSSYLLKADMFLDRHMLRTFSRIVAVIGFCAAATSAMMIPYLFDVERNSLICMFFILIALEAFFELFYRLFDYIRTKRISLLLEEFEMLSLRKLPGKGCDFSSKYVLDKINELNESIASVKSGINQLNARMDRQYKLLKEENKPDDTCNN